jgi:CheY-like chemotaxis protein
MMGEPLEILLVEDNESHAELIMDNLREHRIANHIHLVRNGKDALDYLFREGEFSDQADSPRPHLVMLDLRLPKVDGLDVLKKVKEEESLRSIPVVVLTSSDADQDIERAYKLHANSYLMKPVKFEDFSAMLESLGFYWLAWNKDDTLHN